MVFEPYIWDGIIIALVAYVAVATLVHMMREYRRRMVVQLKTRLIKRQLAERARAEKEAELARINAASNT